MTDSLLKVDLQGKRTKIMFFIPKFSLADRKAPEVALPMKVSKI